MSARFCSCGAPLDYAPANVQACWPCREVWAPDEPEPDTQRSPEQLAWAFDEAARNAVQALEAALPPSFYNCALCTAAVSDDSTMWCADEGLICGSCYAAKYAGGMSP